MIYLNNLFYLSIFKQINNLSIRPVFDFTRANDVWEFPWLWYVYVVVDDADNNHDL